VATALPGSLSKYKPEDIGTLEMGVERIKRRISCHQKRRKLG
jgi:hypothetical protein